MENCFSRTEIDVYRVALLRLGYQILNTDKELLLNKNEKIYNFSPHISFKEVYNKLCPLLTIKNTPVSIKENPAANSVVPVNNNTNKTKQKRQAKTRRRKAQRKRQKEDLIANGVCCHYCEMKLTKYNFSWDHIIPRASGGTNQRNNRIPACQHCNNRKGEMPYEKFTNKPLPIEYR